MLELFEPFAPHLPLVSTAARVMIEQIGIASGMQRHIWTRFWRSPFYHDKRQMKSFSIFYFQAVLEGIKLLGKDPNRHSHSNAEI